MKEIALTQGKTALIDDSDFEYLSQWKWCAKKGRNTFYAVRTDYSNGKKNIYMHREILRIKDPNVLADHKDGNGLNNQKDNIRIATNAQNSSNKKAHKNSTSIYVGVSFYKRLNKWTASIGKNGKYYYLGRFTNEYDAALAYNNEAKKLNGEFANLNKLQHG